MYEVVHAVMLLVLVLTTVGLLVMAASSLESWVEPPVVTPTEAEASGLTLQLNESS